jgi:hypothetical protein
VGTRRVTEKTRICALVILILTSCAFAEEEAEGPQTGYFRVSMTTAELIGPAAAEAVAGILSPDQAIEWEVMVPQDYVADSPPGVVVYVSPRDTAGPPRDWQEMLQAHNLIWIGARDAGNDWPVPERMLKAMFAPMVLSRTHSFAPNRLYVAGMSGGSKTAIRVETAKPDVFKGGIYMAGSVFWGDDEPPKIDLVRENYHAFIIGTNDPAFTDTKRIYNNYKNAGVVNSELFIINNYRHRMPPAEYFEKAVVYLDSRLSNDRLSSEKMPVEDE